MATINIEIPGNSVPVNISDGLETKFFTYQMVAALGGYVNYIVVTGNSFPDDSA